MVSNIQHLVSLSILLSLFNPWARAEWFSATAGMERLLGTHKKIKEDLNDYVTKEEKRLIVLKNFRTNCNKKMVHSILHVACLNILLSPWTRAELYTAIAHLEPLLKTQERIIDDLDDYLMKEDIRLTVLKSYLKTYKEEYNHAIEDVPNYIKNPINAFNLIKRLTTDLNDTTHHIKLGKGTLLAEPLRRKGSKVSHVLESACCQALPEAESVWQRCYSTTHSDIPTITELPIPAEYIESATLNYTDMKYPSGDDLFGAAQAIIRLQNTYHLDVHDLAEGRIQGVQQGSPMSAADCFELSITLFSVQDYQNTVAWSMEALRKYREEAPPPLSFKETDILEYISFSYYLMGNITTALKWTRRLLKLDPNHRKARKNVPIFKEAIDNQTKQPEQEDWYTKEAEGISRTPEELNKHAAMVKTFGSLCRGEGAIANDISKRLHCRYVTETHPFLRLAPFKVEQLYIGPDVSLFHDVISDSEIESLKKRATPRLHRSQAGTTKVEYRISEHSWMDDAESPVVARLTHRVAAMTGLSATSAETLQVLNYGIGGHYMPHVDFNARVNETRVEATHRYGNRIATVLFYMSDVEQGGATVFPHLSLSVFPVKGTALVWLNLLPSGEGDFSTLHGACPVLRGSKWVCTKWLHQSGQEFLKPCNLEYQEEHDTLR